MLQNIYSLKLFTLEAWTTVLESAFQSLVVLLLAALLDRFSFKIDKQWNITTLTDHLLKATTTA